MEINLYASLDGAKRVAEAECIDTGFDHVFIYRLNEQYGIFWHGENRYIFSYLPSGAKLVLHGEKMCDREWHKWVEWDAQERKSAFTKYDRDVLAEQVGDAQADDLIDLFTNGAGYDD